MEQTQIMNNYYDNKISEQETVDMLLETIDGTLFHKAILALNDSINNKEKIELISFHIDGTNCIEYS